MPDPRTDFCFGVLHATGPGGGWSEKYAIKGSGVNLDDAKASFTELVEKRGVALASDCTIVWARVSAANNERDAIAAIVNPIVGGIAPPNTTPKADEIGFINNLGAAVHFRFESAAGKSGNRLFRGIRDDVATAGKAVWSTFTPLAKGADYTPVVLPIGTTPVDTFVPIMAMKNLCQAVRKLTNICRPVYTVVNKRRVLQGYFLYDIERYIYRKIGQHKTGRPFGSSAGRAKAQV